MKASHKILVLSLSAVLVVTGCERRGRAPIKATTPGGQTTDLTKTTPAPLSTSAPTLPTNTDKNVIEISSVESQLVTDAQLKGCKEETINENESASKKTFLADLGIVNRLVACMASNGLKLICSDETGLACEKSKSKVRNWSLDNSSNPEDKSTAYKAFVALSNAPNGNDDDASKIMSSRLELSIIRLGKMDTKYSEDRMKSADFKASDELVDSDGSKLTAAGTLADLAKGVKALEESREAIKALKVSDADRTE